MSDNITQIMGEKLDKSNFQAWKFRMSNFLMGKRVWDIVTRADVEPSLPNQNATIVQTKAYKEWHEKTRKVLHWISICVSDAMIGHIQECTSAKDA